MTTPTNDKQLRALAEETATHLRTEDMNSAIAPKDSGKSVHSKQSDYIYRQLLLAKASGLDEGALLAEDNAETWERSAEKLGMYTDNRRGKHMGQTSEIVARVKRGTAEQLRARAQSIRNEALE